VCTQRLLAKSNLILNAGHLRPSVNGSRTNIAHTGQRIRRNAVRQQEQSGCVQKLKAPPGREALFRSLVGNDI